MSSGGLLEIDPLELKFPFEVKKQISCSLQLTNKSDDYVAFKVKTTSPKKYCVRPNAGIVLPRSTCDVIVTMQSQREAPPDMQCKDKFLVQSVIIDQTATTKDITTEMFAKESGNVVDEVKLRVTYVSPPQPPSPVPEGSEEGSSPRPSVSENGNLNSSELLANVAIISRLTEEKTTAIQQNNKLRQELELVRREVSKQQGGFSFMFVVIIALLGILMGYMFKKILVMAHLRCDGFICVTSAAMELVRREVSKQQGGFSFMFVVIIALLGILMGYMFKK
ncbi:hypothetical protein C4D60_Mb11t04030 [Musa balbisiana]|uniref:MSP domain-containing protein n=1 Tax=Musa balbisiana TaxID=52838 RepID=A0A4S8J1K2_MUSBA|nr:hypothetical protein C4D60_Mb11t04030 [Musa balbisiana]